MNVASTFEATQKKSGKVLQSARNVVSSGGKVMTVTVNGADLATGRKFMTILVLEKQ